MARTVQEVNASIQSTTTVLEQQVSDINEYQEQVNKNAELIAVLTKQQAFLDTLYLELEPLFSQLLGNAGSLEENYGQINIFSAKYAEYLKTELENEKKTDFEIIIDLRERVSTQLGQCNNDLTTAKENLSQAKINWENANNDMIRYQTELQEAEQEALIVPMGDAESVP